MENFKNKFQDYLLLEKNYSHHTSLAYLADLNVFHNFIVKEFDQEDLLEVNYSQVRSWIVLLSDKGISNTSINRKISSLKAFYKFLLKIKQIEINPLLKHKALKVPKTLQIPFSEKEVEEALSQMQNPQGFEAIRNKLIVDLFYTTGMRRTELIHLKKINVDLSKNTIKVLGKRNKERILPL